MQEARKFWGEMLENVTRPSATAMIPYLDMNNPLGVRKADATRAVGGGFTKAPLYAFFMQTKAKHPTKVLLVRVSPRTLSRSFRVEM